MDDTYWAAVTSMRLQVADFLAELNLDDWDAASLCEQWRIRDVAGHLSCVPTITTWQLLAAAPRARFDMNTINTTIARRYGSAEPSTIVAWLRDHADSRRTAKVLDTRNSLFDIIVHSQDISIPLGRSFSIDPDLAAEGLRRVWSMGIPFRARKRFAGMAIQADDADLRLGSGREIRGPALALLLLATGRTDVALPQLSGDGLDTLNTGA